jgi:hypothetical protein
MKETHKENIMKQIKKVLISMLDAWIEGRSQYISSKTR